MMYAANYWNEEHIDCYIVQFDMDNAKENGTVGSGNYTVEVDDCEFVYDYGVAEPLPFVPFDKTNSSKTFEGAKRILIGKVLS